jgi:hypothetical protein
MHSYLSQREKKHTFHTYFFNDERPHMYRTLNKFSFIEMKYTIREDVIEIFLNKYRQTTEKKKQKYEIQA